MLNERLSAAKAVAAELLPTETELESAIVHASKLVIAVIEGRRSAKLPITIGQDSLGHIAQATARLIEARAEIGAAHLTLRETQINIGLRATSFGDLWECPDKKAQLIAHAANTA